MGDCSDLTPQLRAAKVAWMLADGESLRTRDVARICKLSMRGARELLYLLSDKLPIYQDGYIWKRMESGESAE